MGEQKENIHVNHRKRVKQRFISDGLEHTPDHNILELLLFFAVPRKDTNPIAHQLIQQFGSFSRVFEADIDELTSVKGMTKNAAILIKTVIPVCQRYIDDLSPGNHVMSTREAIKSFFLSAFKERPVGSIGVLCLNNSAKMLKFEWIGEGQLTASSENLRKIAGAAFACHASNIILAHSHPKEKITPHPADVFATKKLQRILREMEINLIDHYIVSGPSCISMTYEGYIEFDRTELRR